MRRTATITLHWLTLLLLILLIAGGQIPVLAWAFALAGLTQCAMALAGGLMNGPGAKLEGALRAAHPWLARGMYVGLALVSGCTIWVQLYGPLPGPSMAELYFYLLSVSSLHGIFHLWRHTALGDGALRRITPKSMHGML
jgi:hypothetical protein